MTASIAAGDMALCSVQEWLWGNEITAAAQIGKGVTAHGVRIKVRRKKSGSKKNGNEEDDEKKITVKRWTGGASTPPFLFERTVPEAGC